MDHEIRSALDLALADAIRQGRVLCDNEAAMTEPARSILSVNGQSQIRLHTRGPRSLEEIPPGKLQIVAGDLLERQASAVGSDEHMRTILEWFERQRIAHGEGVNAIRLNRPFSTAANSLPRSCFIREIESLFRHTLLMLLYLPSAYRRYSCWLVATVELVHFHHSPSTLPRSGCR